jgi:hypothetical protein
MDAAHLADQLLPGSTALAGLLLVVLTNLGAAYAALPNAPVKTVQKKYRNRARFIFWAFAAALFSALTAFWFYWYKREILIDISAALFVTAALCSLWTALKGAGEIG